MKGKIGVETNIIIKVPKRRKIECNCKKCMYYKKTACELNRKLFSLECKWFTILNDYDLTPQESKEIQNKNNASKKERKERAIYNNGFGNIRVETADLSKYRRLK